MFWVISSDGISWEKLACAKEKSTVLKAQCFQFAATCFKLATYLLRSGTGRRAHWGACVEVWEGKREKVGARTKLVWLTCPTVVLFTYLAQFTQTNAQKHNCINKLFSCECRGSTQVQKMKSFYYSDPTATSTHPAKWRHQALMKASFWMHMARALDAERKHLAFPVNYNKYFFVLTKKKKYT